MQVSSMVNCYVLVLVWHIYDIIWPSFHDYNSTPPSSHPPEGRAQRTQSRTQLKPKQSPADSLIDKDYEYRPPTTQVSCVVITITTTTV